MVFPHGLTTLARSVVARGTADSLRSTGSGTLEADRDTTVTPFLLAQPPIREDDQQVVEANHAITVDVRALAAVAPVAEDLQEV